MSELALFAAAGVGLLLLVALVVFACCMPVSTAADLKPPAGPAGKSVPTQVQLLEALGIDTSKATRVVLLFRAGHIIEARVTRHLVVDGALLARVERLRLCKADWDVMPEVSSQHAAASMSTRREG